MLELLFSIESLITVTILSLTCLNYKNPIYILYYILLFIGFYIIYFIIFAIIFGLVGKHIKFDKEYKKPNTFLRFIMQCVMGLLIRFLHVKVKVNGIEKLPDTPSLIVQNHVHGLDPVFTVHSFRKIKMAFISKKENLSIPFAGKYMYRSCYQALDREDPRQAIKVINESARLIKELNLSMGVYPEGTRNKTNELLLDFKDGCFKTALKAKCPIVVTTIKNSKKVGKRPHFRRTDVTIDILKVIPYEDIKGLKTVEISEIVRNIMLDDLKDNSL